MELIEKDRNVDVPATFCPLNPNNLSLLPAAVLPLANSEDHGIDIIMEAIAAVANLMNDQQNEFYFIITFYTNINKQMKKKDEIT